MSSLPVAPSAEQRRVAELEAEVRSLRAQLATRRSVAPDAEVSANRLQSLIRRLDIGVLLQGPEAEIIASNPAALRLLGMTEDELVGRSSLDPRWNVIHEDGSPFPGSTHPVPQAIATREPVRDVVMGVFRPRRDDRVWLLVDAVPELDAAGAVVTVLCTFRDITPQREQTEALQRIKQRLEERIEARTAELESAVRELTSEMLERTRAEEALAASETRHRTVVSALAEGVVLQDAGGIVRAANPAAERMLGLPPAASESERPPVSVTLLRPDNTPLPPEEHPAMRSLAEGEALENELVGVRREGDRTVWLAVNTAPIFDPESGAAVAVVSSFRDVTERKKAEDALRESRVLLQRITDAVPGAVYEHVRRGDGSHDLTFVSAGVTELIGRTAEDILRDPQVALRAVSGDKRKEIRERIEASARDGKAFESEFQLQREDGTSCWVRAHGLPEPREEGVAWCGILTDITHEREMEEALQRAQKREAVGDLAAGVAHNFNNMLAGILPNLELCLEDAPPALQPALDDAARAARSAREVVRQLLHLTGKDVQAEASTVPLAKALLDAVRVCRLTFDKRIDLELDLVAEDAAVMGRASQLQQVFLNLLLNARDALGSAVDPRIGVFLGTQSQPSPEHTFLTKGPVAVIQVEDNGCGMSKEVLERIGEPFFTTKGPAQGTGLGLASAYGIVRDHRGWIGCTSRPGRGTKFTVVLPLMDADRVSIEPTWPPHKASDRPLGSGRILLVDDERLVRRSYSRLLTRLGHEVDALADGRSAVERIQGNPGHYDAVILDLSMPGMSGAEVLTELRKIDRDLPVVVLTGYVSAPADLTEADGVLTKPARVDDLARTLAPLLEARQSRPR